MAEPANAPTLRQAIAGTTGTAAAAAFDPTELSVKPSLLAWADPCGFTLPVIDNLCNYIDGCRIVKAAPHFDFHYHSPK
jgi:hypothetical protein